MGTPILIGLVVLGQISGVPILGALIIPPTKALFTFFTGQPI